MVSWFGFVLVLTYTVRHETGDKRDETRKSSRVSCLLSRVLPRVGHWQPQGKRAALAVFAFDFQCAAVEVGDMPNEGET